MSNYYEYRDVKVMIAHALMNMDGWKVYGYHADNSDPMTDYYDPAYWNGIAEKNGYILCVDVSSERGPEEIRKYNYDGTMQDISITEKIKKLQAITVERGASEQEEESAQKSITKLMEKQSDKSVEKYIVTGVIPGHMANPPRMNWHIEKDGVYIAKGNGLLKYSSIDNYYRYSSHMKDMEEFLADKEKWAEDWVQDVVMRGYYTEENAKEIVKSRVEEMEEKASMMEKFKAFIHKIDTTCGGQIGEGDGTFYEKVTVTKYKKENKVIEDSVQDGKIQDGQCFILKSNFNYGCYKGLVYRIHEMEYNNGQKYYTAYKLNGKLTKECHGMASSNNNWTCFNDKFLKWIEQGAIAWCHLEEVKTPYEVEKVVKKTTKKIKEKKTEDTKKANKTTNKADSKENLKKAAETIENPSYTYEITEDTDTRDGSQIWLLKVVEKLSREEYLSVNKYMKSLGSYYSKFKHAFLFRDDPTELLNGNKDNENGVSVENPCNDEIQDAKQQTEQQEETKEEDIKEKEKPICTFVITPDVHTKTKKEIWVVKLDGKLSNDDFAKVRQKLAVLKGFYSSFKGGFIFNYDPTEKLESEKIVV